MNLKRKKYLTLGSVFSIISAGMIFVVGIIILMTSIFYNKNDAIELLKENKGYQFEQYEDGGYSIIYYNEDGDLVVVTEEDMSELILLTKKTLTIESIVYIVYAILKMILAVLVLVMAYREKYNKKYLIGLLVLSCLNLSVIEAVILIVAMMPKYNNKTAVIEDNDL